ncbi:MAG: hypothetical protein ACRD0G_20000, partial [Acidimicrobiales bacterium]
TRHCALCGTEYVEEVVECVECGVPLQDDAPLRASDIADDDGEQLAYDLSDLPAVDRLAVHHDLQAARVDHAFVDDGRTVVIAPADEDATDAVLGSEEAHEGGGWILEEVNGEQLLYDLSDWHVDQRADLARRLVEAGIPHVFDEHGDLIVADEQEERVDAIVDAVDFPDQLPADDTRDENAEAAVEAVHSLFVAADRLVHDPDDTQGVLAADEATSIVESSGPPFGIGTRSWDEVVEKSKALRDLLATEGYVDGEDVVQAAQALRTALRPLV